MYDYERRRAASNAIENQRDVPEVLMALDKLLGNFRTHFGQGPQNKDTLTRFTKRLRSGKATMDDVFTALNAIDDVEAYLKANRMMGGADRDRTKFRDLRRLVRQLLAFDPNAR